MPKKNPWAKWTLPEVVHPETNRCFTVWIPNEQHYIAAFHGAMLDLASAKKWADDEAHTAKEVADVMMGVFRAMETCEMFDVRQSTGAPCTLEKTYDGAIWQSWANLQLCPPRLRMNGQKIEWSNDGGVTWQELTGQGDERQDGTYTPPWPPGSVPPGQSAQCLSAENILSVYSTALTQMRAEVALLKPPTAIAAVGTGILSIFMPVAIIGTIMLVLCGVLEELGTAGIDDMLTTDTLNKLRCNLKDNASSDGSFTAAAYNAFYAQLAVDFSGLKLSALQYYFDMLGPVGLSRQGRADNISTADCDGCGWCYLFDFTSSDYPTYFNMPVDSHFTPDNGVYIPGVGYQDTLCNREGDPINKVRILRMLATWPSATYVTAIISGVWSSGAQNCLIEGWQVNCSLSGSNWIVNCGEAAPVFPHSMTGMGAGTGGYMYFIPGSTNNGTDPGGQFTLTSLKVYGTGVCPFGTPNC